jgi:hypothetical protein
MGKRSRYDDKFTPLTPLLHEEPQQENRLSSKPQIPNNFKPLRILTSIDFDLLTLKRAISLQDSKDTSVDIGSEQDSKESSLQFIMKVDRSGVEHGTSGTREPSFDIPTTCRPTPKFILRIQPRLTSIPSPSSQGETSYEEKTNHQQQILTCKAAMGTFNPDNILLVPPRLDPPPAPSQPPPLVPWQTDREDDTFITSIPEGLHFPRLH